MQEQRAALPRHTHLLALLKTAGDAFAAEVARRLEAAGYPDIRQAHGCVFGHVPAEGARLTQLAEVAGLTKQAVGEVATDLQQLGYLERVSDPTDGRAKILRLTAEGREAQDTGLRIIAEIEAEWTERFGQDEVASMRDLLEQVAELRAPAAT